LRHWILFINKYFIKSSKNGKLRILLADENILVLRLLDAKLF